MVVCLGQMHHRTQNMTHNLLHNRMHNRMQANAHLNPRPKTQPNELPHAQHRTQARTNAHTKALPNAKHNEPTLMARQGCVGGAIGISVAGVLAKLTRGPPTAGRAACLKSGTNGTTAKQAAAFGPTGCVAAAASAGGGFVAGSAVTAFAAAALRWSKMNLKNSLGFRRILGGTGRSSGTPNASHNFPTNQPRWANEPTLWWLLSVKLVHSFGSTICRASITIWACSFAK